MIKDRRASCASGIITGWDPKERKRCLGSHRIAISDIGEDKSFADDLNKERGIVSSRVALLLRSAEIKPLFSRFVSKETSPLLSVTEATGHSNNHYLPLVNIRIILYMAVVLAEKEYRKWHRWPSIQGQL